MLRAGPVEGVVVGVIAPMVVPGAGVATGVMGVSGA